jgi:hypothetical protein
VWETVADRLARAKPTPGAKSGLKTLNNFFPTIIIKIARCVEPGQPKGFYLL